jgi:hypothetical protein
VERKAFPPVPRHRYAPPCVAVQSTIKSENSGRRIERRPLAWRKCVILKVLKVHCSFRADQSQFHQKLILKLS